MGALTCRGVRRSARTAAVPGHPLTPSRPPAPAPGRGAVPGGGARRDRGRWPGTVAFAEDVLPSQPRSAAAGGARAPRRPRCRPPRLTANVFFQGRRGFPAVFVATLGSRLTHACVQLSCFAFFSGEGAASCDRQAGSRSRSRGGASSTCFSPSGCRWTWLCGVLCRQARPPVDIDYCDPIVSTPFTATQEGRVVTLSAWMGDEPLVRLPCSRGAPPAGRRRHRVPPPSVGCAAGAGSGAPGTRRP